MNVGISREAKEFNFPKNDFCKDIFHLGATTADMPTSGWMALLLGAGCGLLRIRRPAASASLAWQRCQFHLQQNAQDYAPRLDMRAQIARDIRSVFNSPDRAHAERRLKEINASYIELDSIRLILKLIISIDLSFQL